MKDCCGEVDGEPPQNSETAPTASSAPSAATCAPVAVPVQALRQQDACCAHTPSTVTINAPTDELQPGLDRSTHVLGDDCCSSKEQEIVALGAHFDVKRVLQMVLVINLVMFVAEFAAGLLASSTALMADSVDMLGDALGSGLID